MNAADKLAELRTLAQNASPGPWAIEPHPFGNSPARSIHVADRDADEFPVVTQLGCGCCDVGLDADAEDLAYIAAANPATVLRLIDALEAVLAGHRPVTYSFSWTEGVQMNEVCPTCHDKAGVHECGCWREGDEDDHQCAVCSMPEVKGGKVAWPCKTYNAIQTALGVTS